jgi:hypothetical protein
MTDRCGRRKNFFGSLDDHYIVTKAGTARPVVIPKKTDLKVGLVLSVGRTLGLNRGQMKAE